MIIGTDFLDQKPSKFDDRWPQERGALQRFTMDHRHHPGNMPAQAHHYEREMRSAFGGRRITVLDNEVKNLVMWLATDKTDPVTGKVVRERRDTQREFFKIERDAWLKAPDPYVSGWGRFKLWLFRRPLPKANEPDRIVTYYSMSLFQAKIFRHLWVNEFSKEDQV